MNAVEESRIFSFLKNTPWKNTGLYEILWDLNGIFLRQNQNCDWSKYFEIHANVIFNQK